MKRLLQDNAGFQLYAEMRPIASLANKEARGNTYELKFTTVWKDSQNPDDEMVKAQFFLNEEAVDILWKLIGTN